MNKALASVVIPTFNRAPLLKQAIDSALAQDFDSFEVVVVDDGSTDGTPELLEFYGPRIHCTRSPHRGAGRALNIGCFEESSGDFVILLSDDDLLAPDCLSALMKEAGPGVTYGNYVRSDGRFVEEPEFDKQGLLHAMRPSAVSSLISREALKEVGRFDESLSYAQDYDWWLRAAFLHGVEFRKVSHTAPVATYKVSPNQRRSSYADFATREAIKDKVRRPFLPRLRPLAYVLWRAGL